MKTLWTILLYIWQLPQNLLGLAIVGWLRICKREIDEKTHDFAGGVRYYYCVGFPGGISLGRRVVLSALYNHWGDQKVERHEYGHCRQSLYLGWLYLLVVGLPSLLWAAFYSYDPDNPNGYYTGFYTERWADKLGGVQR